MAEFGISMDGRAPVTDIPAQAKAAEEGGASTLWIACHLYLRDPITMAALALGATRRIKIALMAMSPYSVHPVFIAMAAATLDEMYPGRVILCLGAGAPADLKAAGLEATKPLVSIGETVKICRALLAGEMADFQGPDVPRLRPAAGQWRPKGTDRAGGLARAHAEARRPRERRRADLGRDLAALREGLPRRGGQHQPGLPQGRHRLHQARRDGEGRHRSDPPADRLRAARCAPCREHPPVGRQLDQAALATAYAAENWAEVDRLVSDDVVRRHAACGTPDQVRAKLDEYRAIGLDEVVIGGMDDAPSIAAALPRFGGE
jgi:5,10-methylenetetrahydromethanopterin reductase